VVAAPETFLVDGKGMIRWKHSAADRRDHPRRTDPALSRLEQAQ
jgi:peroxiredoxin